MQGHICVPIHLHDENVEMSFSQNVLKTNGKVVTRFSYIQFFSPGSYLSLPLGYIHVKNLYSLQVLFFETTLPVFIRFNTGPSVKGVLTIWSNDDAPWKS